MTAVADGKRVHNEAAAALEKAFASELSGVGNPLANKVIEAAEQRVSTAN